MRIRQNSGAGLIDAVLSIALIAPASALAQETIEGVAAEYVRDTLAFYGPYGGILACLIAALVYFFFDNKRLKQENKDLYKQFIEFAEKQNEKSEERLASNIAAMQKLTYVIEAATK